MHTVSDIDRHYWQLRVAQPHKWRWLMGTNSVNACQSDAGFMCQTL